MPDTSLKQSEIAAFQSWLLHYHQTYGRHDLPWRTAFEPYHVLVSEIMLQQTQVDRVIPKFEAWLKQFPDVGRLAAASPREVITAWQGLGYNRRGLNLQRAAQTIVAQFNGQVPAELDQLLTLPGIGPYTAAAIQAFAFNLPAVVIETNIRTVFIHHFFPDQTAVPDDELKPLIAATVPHDRARIWYSALMDYGTHLKQVLPNPTRRSRHYAKQSTFQGSRRQLRGQVLKNLSQQPQVSYAELAARLQQPSEVLDSLIRDLTQEGFISYNQDTRSLQLRDTQ